MFWLPAAIAGAASLAGGAISAAGQSATNEANAREARLNREFQERMSSTAWQRGVEDMRKAGLNPALAYEKGGASSPQGGMARMENALAGAGSTAREATSTYMTGIQTRAQVANSLAQADKTAAEANQIKIESAARLAAIEANIRAMSTSSGLNAQRLLTEKQETERRMLARFREGIGYDLDKQTLDYRSVANDLKLKLLGYEEDVQRQIKDTIVARNFMATEAARFGLPALRNRAAAADTFIGRYIMPYLSTGAQAAGAVTNIRRSFD